MTIQSRLNFIISGITGAFAVALGIIMFTVLQAGKIDSERKIISDLSLAYHKVTVESSLLYTEDLRAVEKRFDEALVLLESAIDSFASLQVLPGLSPEIADSFAIIDNLNKLQAKYVRALPERISHVKETYSRISGFDFSMIYGFVVADIPLNSIAVNHEDYEILLQGRTELYNAVRAIENNSGFEKLIDQNNLISGEIQRSNSRGFRFTLVISCFIAILSFVVAMALAYRIRKPLSGIRSVVKSLTDGNLDVQFSRVGNDEISELSTDLGQFLHELRSSISRISRSSGDNRRIRDNMIGAVEETSAATRQIRANMKSIAGQFAELDTSVDSSVFAIREIRDVAAAENDQIREQMAMVEQSAASVRDMIESINTIASLTKGNRKAAAELVSAAQSGGEKLKKTSGIISEIDDSVEDIKNMTGLIQAVAGQTNLLAMNAAIEAAHAGDSGRGFAVVADEIRKLAEMSSRSSKHIASSLKIIVERISQAGLAAGETTEAFEKIDSEIHGVEKSFIEISESLEELERGNSRMLDAMKVLGSTTALVGEGAEKLKGASDSVGDTIDDVRRVSAESIAGISEMSAGIDEINRSIEYLVQLSTEVQDVSLSLSRAVEYFRLNSGEERNDEGSGSEQDAVLLPV